MVLGKLCHVKQWPNQSSYTSNHLIAKRDEYPCHAKQWPTPTSLEESCTRCRMNKLNFYSVKRNFRMKNEPMANDLIHI